MDSAVEVHGGSADATSKNPQYPDFLLPKHSITFQLEDGWIIDKDDVPCLWVPPSYRPGLQGPRSRVLVADNKTELDFSRVPIGEEWPES